MGFMIHSTDDGRTPATEYLPAGAITPKVGMALKMTGGLLVPAVGSDRPGYICMTQRETACEAGEHIPVIRAGGDIIFETAFSAAAGSVKLGDKVTISADGLGVTATVGGPAEVVYMDGTENGSMCRVRFD
ncbi:hypothetical protein [uncultured Oscillibacter sp.]|jgi:hypothetical protein|uniref:hypothetical protein n=1 Tax=uncultured Oscillibacter sp. TaxID=876091 RepID=UPI00261E28B6|nr:hypothetical protein [uncultured Oscillibacter sp.]